MNAYEIMYVMRPEQEIVEDVILKFNNLIASNGGVVEKTERWGERRMPYVIQDYENGIYVLVTFHASKKCVLKLHKKNGDYRRSAPAYDYQKGGMLI